MEEAEFEIDDFELICEFRSCQNIAEYEGWYRILDFAGIPTGMIQKMCVCRHCAKYLIGYNYNNLLPEK